MKKIFIAVSFAAALGLSVFAAAHGAHADAPQFQPIVPLPNNVSYNGLSFPDYVNLLFKWSIGIGAMMAVLMFVYGGFLYMTSDAVKTKKNGLDHIRDALIGLLLLISVVIILQVINPCILHLNVFSSTTDAQCSPGGGAGTSTNPSSTQTNNQATETPQAQGSPVTNFAQTGNAGSMANCLNTDKCCKNIQNICVLSNGNYVPRPGPHCITGSPKDACAAGDLITLGLNAQGAGYLGDPLDQTKLVQFGPRGSIAGCPSDVFQMCYAGPGTAPTRTNTQGACTGSAQLIDACERPKTSI